FWAGLIAALAAGVALVLASPAFAVDLDTPHPSLVPEVPRADIPKILDGDVFDIVVVGNYIVAGGDFTTIERSDGTTFQQPYLAAFDIDSGEFVESFTPVLNDEVSAISPAPEVDHVFVGGKFTDINGLTRNRLAKLSLVDGSVTSFVSNASGKVQELDLDSGRLFVGGTFNKIKGQFIDKVADVDPFTGQPNLAFNFDFQGEASNYSGGQNIKHLEVTPDGTKLLIVHSAASIDGQQRSAAAIIDITDPAAPMLTDYSLNDFFDDAPRGPLPTDADISPDGTYFAMSTIIGDINPWHDMTMAFPIAGGPDTPPLWTHRMRDSVYSVAVSNNAVYAGGHFCRINIGPGPTNPDGRDDKTCSGSGFNGAWRWQLAALDPADGTPLDWDPGSNSGHGVVALTVTDRGLLIGHDGSFAGGINTGRMGFFDFGGPNDVQAPTLTIDTPLEGQSVASPPSVAGTAADDHRVDVVRVRLRDTATQLWLQSDGSFGPVAYDFDVAPELGGSNETVNWSFTYPVVPDGSYRIEARALDPADNVSDTAVRLFSVGPPTPDCSATVNAGNHVELNWLPVPGEDTYSVRRDGAFLASVGNGGLTYTDTTVGNGLHNYIVRSSLGGVTTEYDCGTVDITLTLTCSAVVDANNHVVLNWDPVPGEDKHIVRRDGNFLSSVTNFGTTYTDATVGMGTHSYIVRSRQAGVTTDIDCGSVTIDLNLTCSAVVDVDDNVILTWDPVPGEDTHVVRRDGAFVTSVGNFGTTYTDLAVPVGTHSYLVRSSMGGVLTDIDCGSITIDPPPPATCAAVVDANGDVTLTWDEIAGENSYNVRRDAVWIGNSGASTTFFDDQVLPGDHSYVIRYNNGAGVTDIVCQPDPITVP
ncbi:MAG: hypothetical protein HKN26_16450, partial [Acidimicrobiales bacterium]|nr:hypothetical protein [Acidimicrobiales bacterium]